MLVHQLPMMIKKKCFSDETRNAVVKQQWTLIEFIHLKYFIFMHVTFFTLQLYVNITFLNSSEHLYGVRVF